MKKIKKTKMFFISVLTTVSLSAYAASQETPITFYNNTNQEVTVAESTFIGGMTECTGSPYNQCLKQQPPITLDPHSSGVINLVSAVSAQKIYYGAIGFLIQTDGNSQNMAVISVMANPIGAFAVIDFCLDQGVSGSGCYYQYANSQNVSYALNSLPKYSVSVAQNIQNNGSGSAETAQQTVVSINPVQVQQ